MLSKNKNNSSKTMEFLTLISLVIGIVIGSGIFVKNDTEMNHVLGMTHGNGYIGIIVWGFIGLLCVFAMLGFIEIASSTHKSGNGSLSNWVKMFIGKKTASFVSMIFIVIWYPIIQSYFAMLLVKYFIDINNLQNSLSAVSQKLLYFFLGFTFLLFFILLNSFTTRPGKYFQICDTIFKIVPIVVVLVGCFFTHGSNSVLSQKQDWKFSYFLMATGPILFSFDGFLFASNLQKETKNRNLLYKALIIGMVFVALIYILESAALFYGTKDGNALTLLRQLFGPNVGKITNWIIILMIITGLNGYSIVSSRNFFIDSQEGIIYSFKGKSSLRKSGLMMLAITSTYFIIFNVIGDIVNTNDPKISLIYYLDLFSNLISVFSFSVYIILLIAMVVNRFTHKVEITHKIKLAPFAAVAFAICLSLLMGYRVFTIFYNWDTSSLILISLIVFAFIATFTNEYLIKKSKNKSMRLFKSNNKNTKFKLKKEML